jgi:hypothetical protein
MRALLSGRVPSSAKRFGIGGGAKMRARHRVSLHRLRRFRADATAPALGRLDCDGYAASILKRLVLSCFHKGSAALALDVMHHI